MIDQNNKAKEAKAQVAQDKIALSNIEETNPYAALQAPDISSLANQQIAQSTQEGVAAAKDLGQAGAAQVTGMVQAGRNSALKAAESQAKANYSRDVAVAQGAADVNKREAEAKRSFLKGQISDNTAQMQNAQANVNAGVADLFSGTETLIGEVGEAGSLENKAKRAKKKDARDLARINDEQELAALYGTK